MLSANTIMKISIKFAIFLSLLIPVAGFSQLNSPYSRYGIGNLTPQGNISNRAMGGISAAIADPSSQNTVNPASYGNLVFTTLDFAIEYNGMNLKSKVPVENFKSNYAILSYLNVGVPLLSGNERASKSKTSWALSFGLKPVSKINYSVSSSQRSSIDSTTSIYQGEGGINKAYIGSALKLKNFSFGFNSGYLFGEKNYSTQLIFNNDSVHYNKAYYQTNTHFGGIFLDLGAQYQIALKKGYLRLGAYTDLKSTYNARRDETRETFTYGNYNEINPIDSVYETVGDKGKILIPSTYGFGLVYENDHLLIGADYETSQWSDYTFFGQKDFTQNSWLAKVGFQYYPATTTSTSFLSFVKYRAGFSIGKDYINIDNQMPVYTISAGAALPLRLRRSFYDRQFSLMNITFEYGSRGNKNNNITESSYKLSFGFSLSDVWFLRQKYQ